MFRWASVIAVLFGSLTLLAQQTDDGLSRIEDAFVKSVEKARASVVSIASTYVLPAEKDAEPETYEISFSGVVLDGQGHIVTVASAAKGAKEIEVTASDEQEYKATVVGLDERSNLAVLHVDAEGLVPVELAEPGTTRVGSWVIAVGNAFGMPRSVSYGIVGGLDRDLGTGAGIFTNMLQTTAPINPGDSGGLLANSKGQLVGVISSTFQRAPSLENFQEAMKDLMRGSSMDSLLKDIQDLQTSGASDPAKLQQLMSRWMKRIAERSASGGQRRHVGGAMSGRLLGGEGVNFATPIETVRFVTKQLIEKGKVDRGWLGAEVQPIPAPLRAKLHLAGAVGVLISRVVEEGPAEQGGLKAQDVILKVNGKPLARFGDLERYVAQSAQGTQLTLEVASGGDRKEIVVKVGARPEEK